MAQLELHDYLTYASRDEDYGTARMRDEDWWFVKPPTEKQALLAKPGSAE